MNALSILLLTAAAGADPAAPPPVPATRDDVKHALEASKKATPRLPFPTEFGEKGRPGVNNGAMRYHLPAELRDGGFLRGQDPAMSLDPRYKVMLFWVTSRINNCYY